MYDAFVGVLGFRVMGQKQAQELTVNLREE